MTSKTTKTPGNFDLLETLLTRKNGTSIDEMIATTGWQKHSVRGAMAGALKKRGLAVTSEKADTAVRREPYRMSEDVDVLVAVISKMELDELRTNWTQYYGAPPSLRSLPLMRMQLAWRIQADTYGGLDAETRKELARSGSVEPEGKELGIGARLFRNWKGKRIEIVVEEEGFRWNNQIFPTLSAAARAITNVRWNGPRFFGLRELPRAKK